VFVFVCAIFVLFPLFPTQMTPSRHISGRELLIPAVYSSSFSSGDVLTFWGRWKRQGNRWKSANAREGGRLRHCHWIATLEKTRWRIWYWYCGRRDERERSWRFVTRSGGCVPMECIEQAPKVELGPVEKPRMLLGCLIVIYRKLTLGRAGRVPRNKTN
jgi:hypothetical protein